MNVVNVVNRGMIAVLAACAVAGAFASAWADVDNPNGIVFRAVGIFQGTTEEGRCTVPSAGQAIADQAQAVCRDATEVVDPSGGPSTVEPTVMYPAFGPYFLGFCGGFLELQNNMINQAVNLKRIRVWYRIPGQGFPVLCRAERRFRLYVGGRIDPVNSVNPSPFGAPNISFTQMLPIFSPQLFDCLRDPARGNVPAPVTMRATVTAVGTTDDGRKIRSNRTSYTLTLLPEGATPSSGGQPPAGNPLRCSPPGS